MRKVYKKLTNPALECSKAPANTRGLKTWVEWVESEVERIGDTAKMGAFCVWPGVRFVWVKRESSCLEYIDEQP